jgi:hypothetical protein
LAPNTEKLPPGFRRSPAGSLRVQGRAKGHKTQIKTFPLFSDAPEERRRQKTEAEAWAVETLGGKLKPFFLPQYSPDRNPDELVWKHLKADTLGRMVTTSKADFTDPRN